MRNTNPAKYPIPTKPPTFATTKVVAKVAPTTATTKVAPTTTTPKKKIPANIQKIMREYQTSENEARRIAAEQKKAQKSQKNKAQSGQNRRNINTANMQGQIRVAKMAVKDLQSTITELGKDIKKFENIASGTPLQRPNKTETKPTTTTPKKRKVLIWGTFSDLAKAAEAKKMRTEKNPNYTVIIKKTERGYTLIGRQKK